MTLKVVAGVLLTAMTGSMALAEASGERGSQEAQARGLLETITIIGTRESARQIPGSGAVVDAEQLTNESLTDVNQALKTVPGIYVREEDGDGLRPNIGIRGATAERSSKITIMEDGVLMAPAPYSNPAAYYFPEMLRMSAIEVLKGAPLLRHGPQTTGGVVNLVSTPIPDALGGLIKGTFGEHGTRDVRANIGGRHGGFGWLVETLQRDSDGFKNIDRSNADTGHDIEDYMVKLGWEGERQQVLFKAQYSDEVSDKTYLGLTDADFAQNPNRRYGLSVRDQMTAEHEGYSLVHSFAVSDRARVTTTAYYNDFKRNWFKLGGGSAFIDRANAGDAEAQAILNGTQDVAGLTLRNNARAYESYGLDLNFGLSLNNHELEFGGRVHRDEMDRFQPDEIFDQVNGQLVFRELVEPSGSNNRFEQAKALSLWAVDTWQVSDALKLNLVLRYEDVETSRNQFADPARTVLQSQRRNSNAEWLPGVSFTYDLGDRWQILAGYHRGFSPLGGGATEFEKPEISDNFEAGVRFSEAGYFAEAIGFFSDFSNKTENCSVGNPCSNGETSGSFTTGEAVIAGVELQLGKRFDLRGFSVPVDLAYTHTRAEISKDNPVTGFADGDRLADVPKNTFSLRLGLEAPNGWDNYLTAKFIDAQCDTVGCNTTATHFDETESLFVVDFNSRYALGIRQNLVVLFKVENVFDTRSIVSRAPDGARPNKPRTALAGLEYRF